MTAPGRGRAEILQSGPAGSVRGNGGDGATEKGSRSAVRAADQARNALEQLEGMQDKVVGAPKALVHARRRGLVRGCDPEAVGRSGRAMSAGTWEGSAGCGRRGSSH